MESLAQRVARLRERLNLNQSELAKKLGITPQAIQKLEVGGVKKPRFIVPLAEALGTTPEFLETGKETTRKVQVMGYVQAGEFASSWEWPLEDRYGVTIPAEPDLAPFQLYAAETKGPSMNRRYPERTVLVFTDCWDTGEALIPGKRYIVERKQLDGTSETTVKTLWQDETGRLWLVPESDDPRFKQPIPIDGNEGDEIKIKGRVRFAVMRE